MRNGERSGPVKNSERTVCVSARSLWMLPLPPHCATSRPPGFRTRASAPNSASWSGIQWKRRVREDRVDRLRQLQLDQVLTRERRSIAERLPGMLDHRRGDVDPVHAPLRNEVRDQRRDPTGAAAGVEHDLVAGEVEALELLARPRELWL